MGRDGSDYGKSRFWKIAGCTTVVTILFWVLVIPFWYGTWKDTDSVVNRAQVAAEADDMLAYLQQLKTNLEDHHMTSGHTAVVFKGPDNDLALNYLAVNRLIERLQGIRRLDKSSTAYQTALDDIRGTLRELPNPTSGYIWVHIWFWFLIILIWWIATAAAAAAWMIAREKAWNPYPHAP